VAHDPKGKSSQISLQALIIIVVVFGLLHLLMTSQGIDISPVIPLSLAIVGVVTIGIKML
jgi:hypothetical protein